MVRIEKRLSMLFHKVRSTYSHGCKKIMQINTCVCCRDVGVKAIENLMEKKGKFDYILLETSGLADPGPIASMFWLDDGLGSEIYLDGIVTLVDAKNIRDHMNEKKKDVMINEALK